MNENMKVVYKVVGQGYEIWLAPKDSTTSRPYTEVEPPKGPDVMIAGFDWENNQWIWVRGVPYDLYVRSNQIAANTMKEVTNDKIVPLSVSFLFVILLFFLCVLFVIIKEKWGNC
ncbi:hypothetical protein KMA69_08245 [Enterococcus faecium]|uniref:hypothetical protein n=1 Tax=Enterococcus faecium TaxID=1352 RepID=UPI001E45F982|nr:hypothetical protein [Enterococcus faecium]MCB8536506.1 hypothetical protein [Enterococcus faecium]